MTVGDEVRLKVARAWHEATMDYIAERYETPRIEWEQLPDFHREQMLAKADAVLALPELAAHAEDAARLADVRALADFWESEWMPTDSGWVESCHRSLRAALGVDEQTEEQR